MPEQDPDERYGWLYGSDGEPTRRAPAARDDLPPPQLPPPGSRPPADGPRRGRGDDGARPPRQGRRFGRLVAVVLVAWIAYLVIVPFYALSSAANVEADPGGDRPGDQPGTTYLLVGSDSREGLSGEELDELSAGGVETGGRGRTDTILVLHIGSGPALLMSVPRDSMVDVPGYGTTKINAAYAYGGPQLLVQTIELNTGIRVDDYVEIGFSGLVDVVDAVGGVEICPEEALNDRDSGLDVQAGCQEADGATALAYSRNRKSFAAGDIQRVQSQREVLQGIADKVVSPWTVLNPVRYWGVNSGAARSVQIGEGTGAYDLARFALGLRSAMGPDGLSCTVPLADFSVRWDPERSRQMFDLVAADRTGRIGDLCTPDGLPRGS